MKRMVLFLILTVSFMWMHKAIASDNPILVYSTQEEFEVKGVGDK